MQTQATLMDTITVQPALHTRQPDALPHGLSEALDQHGMRWTLLAQHETETPAMLTTRLHVEREQTAEFSHVLLEQGFMPLHGRQVWLAYDPAAERWLKIDIRHDTRNHPVALVGQALRRIFPGGGMNLAILGPDGAGKSTLVKAIRANAPVPARTLYMGLGEEQLPLIARIRPQSLRSPFFLLMLWWHFVLAKFHQARGRLVIFDRYTYDALLPVRQPMSRVMAVSRWLRAHALPAPDMVIVLDVPGSVMYARKGEHNPAHLEQERQDFLALTQRVPRVHVIDNTRPVQIVRDEVFARIVQQQNTLRREISR